MSNLDELLRRGKELFSLIVRETAAFQKDFNRRSAEETTRFLALRQELMGEIQNFDVCLADCLERRGAKLDVAGRKRLEQFGKMRDALIRKVLETDSSLKCSADKRLDELKKELGSLSQGWVAMRGYAERACTGRGLDLNV